jgi:hypothetical protein
MIAFARAIATSTLSRLYLLPFIIIGDYDEGG